MNNKIELLKDLLELNESVPQSKLNKIIQTLVKTDDIMKARMLSERILKGDFSDLKEEAIDNLIEAFAIDEDNDKEESSSNNKDQNLEFELKTVKLQLEAAEYKNKQLEEKNNKLTAILSVTKMFELIDVSDKDINELYILNLQDDSILENGNAVILSGNIIPKSY